jgi:hypothetical protein
MIRAEIKEILFRQSRMLASVLGNQGFNISGMIAFGSDWIQAVFSSLEGFDTREIPAGGCEEDRARFERAFRAENNAVLYSKGSVKFSQQMVVATRLFHQVSSSDCLSESDDMVVYARRFLAQRKSEIRGIIKGIKSKGGDPKERKALLASLHPDEVAVFSKLDPQWYADLKIDGDFFAVSENSRSGQDTEPKMEAKKRDEIKSETGATAGTKQTDGQAQAAAESVRLRPGKPGTLYPLSLDVWQSAWGDFSEMGELLRYLRRNRIHQINLNPGLPMGPKFYAEGYKKFKPLVKKFYAGGVKRISFLYAELNYPIAYFAKFLHDHPDLRIDTIVDDSEFVDIFRSRFEKNLSEVKRWGIKYSAFVTLESSGNSGVSDSTRFWVLDHVDYPILMSYFGCSLDTQKEKLEKYLNHADRRGIRRRVGVAILLGSKKVGREVSCEFLLSEDQMKRFLMELHRWARTNHPSYGGIVLETNLKMPRVDVYWNTD